MKHLIFAALLLISFSLHGQTTNKTAFVDFGPELAKVTEDLKLKFEAPPASRTNFDENLKAINALLTQHLKDGNREQLARLYLLAAHIEADGRTNTTKAKAIWRTVVRNYPGTTAAKGAAISLNKAVAQEAAEDAKIPEGLEIGQRFPAFVERDLAGNPLALAAYRGRVTMIDFWATWCPPCRAEMPNVIATYQKYHAQGFEIIGVSLDQKRENVLAFAQAGGMAWAQYFDGLGWKNKLAVKYGVASIPATYLLDKRGVIIGKELRGQELGEAVASALAKD